MNKSTSSELTLDQQRTSATLSIFKSSPQQNKITLLRILGDCYDITKEETTLKQYKNEIFAYANSSTKRATIGSADMLDIEQLMDNFAENVLCSNIASLCKITDAYLFYSKKEIWFPTDNLTMDNIFLFDDFTLKLMKKMDIDLMPFLISSKDIPDDLVSDKKWR